MSARYIIALFLHGQVPEFLFVCKFIIFNLFLPGGGIFGQHKLTATEISQEMDTYQRPNPAKNIIYNVDSLYTKNKISRPNICHL